MKAGAALFCAFCASMVSAHIVASPVYAVRRSIDSKPRAMRAREEQLRRRLERRSRSQKSLSDVYLGLEGFSDDDRILDICEVSECDIIEDSNASEGFGSREDEYGLDDEEFVDGLELLPSTWELNEINQVTEITIGKPPQKILVIISISDNDLLVPSSQFHSTPYHRHLTYNSSASSSYNEIKSEKNWMSNYHLYGYGTRSMDITRIAGLDIEDNVFIEGGKLWYNNDVENGEEGWDGYLGLAASNHSSQSGISSVFQTMVTRNLLHQNLFSLKLSGGPDDPGEIMFGGINYDLFRGELKTMPLVNHENSNWLLHGRWAVPIESISMGGESVSLDGWVAAIESDMPWIVVTSEWRQLFEESWGMEKKYEDGTPSIDCAGRDKLEDLVFTMRGHNFAISAYDYTLEVYLEEWGGMRCISIVKSLSQMTERKYIILGSLFLRKFYGVFDSEAGTVSLAEARSPKWGERDLRNDL